MAEGPRLRLSSCSSSLARGSCPQGHATALHLQTQKASSRHERGRETGKKRPKGHQLGLSPLAPPNDFCVLMVRTGSRGHLCTSRWGREGVVCGDWVSQSTPSTLGHVIRASHCGEWLHNGFHPGSSFFFFNVDHFQSLYSLCYHIASVLCFDFLAMRHVVS